jgi:aminopeptidase N
MPRHALPSTALLVILVGLLLSACSGPAAQAPTAAPAPTAAAAQAVAPTAAPTQAAAPTEAPSTAPAPTEAPALVPTQITLPTPQASPNLAGVGDSYFPFEGNPGYDAQHYTVEIGVNPTNIRQISGTTTMEALATSDLSSFNLDFLGFEVSAVTVDGNKATFSRDGQELTITPASPIAAGAPFTVAVSYAGEGLSYVDAAMVLFQPPLVARPLMGGWTEWSDGYVAAFSQPDGGMAWFPSNNTPRDKATYTFRISVDTPKMGLASGMLKEVIPVDTDTNTYVWEMNQPMSTQVASVMVGEFELHESKTPGGIPIRNYFPPGTDPQTIANYEAINEKLDFLANIFGPYPYEAYGHIAIPGWLQYSGYETQSLTTVSAEDTTPAVGVHEMGHQWFGNALTVRDWKDVWLHEGFARYIQLMEAEKLGGVDLYNQYLEAQVNHQREYPRDLPPLLGRPRLPEGQVLPAIDQGVEYAYWSSYTAGALALHGLRMEVGDEIFFEILPTFYQKYKDIPVTTDDFIATAEELAGRDLSSVWDTWLYGTTMPEDFPRLTEPYEYPQRTW